MSNINYFDIIKKSWSITWNHKHLWWFGFFITLAGLGGSLNYRANTEEQLAIVKGQLSDLISQNLNLLIAVSAVALILFIAIIILSIIGRGALIHSAHTISKHEPVTFKAGFAIGQKYFWRIFGIGLFLTLLTIIILCIILVPIFFLFISESYVLGGILAFVGIILLIPLIILLAFVKKFSHLYAVLGNLKIRPALENACTLFLKNIKVSIIMALLFIPITIVLGLGAMLVIFLLGAIFFALGSLFFFLFGKVGASFSAALAALVFLIIFLAVRSVYETFAQTVWILFFHEIAKPKIEEKAAEPITEKSPGTIATPDPVTFSEE